MANYGGAKSFKRYRQLLCGVDKGILPPCEKDIDEVIKAWNDDPEYYNSGLDDYKKGIINIWGTDPENTDDDLGLEQLKRAADAGNINAMNLCGMANHLIYLQGKPSLDEEQLKQCEDNAIKYWQMGADKNQSEAMCNLAICYLEGTHVEQDIVKAKDLLQKAIKARHPAAKQYLKDAKLDKWRPGDEYEPVYLTMLEAMRNVKPKQKKPSVQEKITEAVQSTVAKSQCVSLKEAMKLMKDYKPGFMIVDCIQYDYYFVFSMIDEDNLDKESAKHWMTDQYHYKINRISREINEHSVANMVYAIEGKHGHFETYLSKEDASFIKRFWSDSWFD